MKKFWLTLVLCLTCAFCAVGFAACSGSAVEFKINFVVDGEIYATVDTNGGETIKMPDNPTKDDYTFDGWFWDKNVWEKPFTANSLLDAPLSSDMSVYAKWKSNHNFVEQITKQPTCTEKGEKTFSCECGYSYTKEINALGHKFTNYVSDNNATYEKDGTKTAVCDRGCGATDTITDVGSKLPEITEYFEKKQDGTYYGKVYNATTQFDFTDKIDYDGEYFVCTDAACTNPLADNKTSLNVGNNTFYILYDNGQKTTATVRRRTIYTVTFNSDGGTAVSSQTVEEDRHAVAPKNPMRVGYTFNAWDYDFNEPITKNTTITALWHANTNTPYKIEYYLQNLENDEYSLQENDTEYLTGTTDTTASEIIDKTYEHFTIVSIAFENIKPDGTTALRVYYKRNQYKVKILASNKSVTLSKTFNGQYKYGYIIPEITANYNTAYNSYLGCDKWHGWYNSNKFMTLDFTIPSFVVDKNINYCAKGGKEEMSNFKFNSTATTCEITGVNDETVTEIIIPDYVTKIGQDAFRGCRTLASITIPDSVTSIGSYAFYNCALISVTIGKGVKSIGDSAFSECCKLVEIINKSNLNITKGSTSNGKVGYYALYVHNGESKITNQDGYQFITDELGTNYLLGYTGTQTKLILPDNYNGENYELYRNAFYKCSSLTSITIPNSITNIESETFYGCSGLTNITIPDSVTSIGHGAFCGCFNLTSIIIPNSVTSISVQAFYGCSSLTSITIPDKVTRIEKNEFLDCSSLTSITIPDSITSIGSSAFHNCIRLTSITYKGTIEQWQAINKDNVWKNRVPSSCKVHCTDGDLYI